MNNAMTPDDVDTAPTIHTHQKLTAYSLLLRIFSNQGIAFFFIASVFVLLAQVLWLEFLIDDYYHQLVISGGVSAPDGRHWILSMFTFFDGNSERTAQMVKEFALPWWTRLDIKISFLRPLTAFTHFIDNALQYNNRAFFHLHSLLWYGFFLVAVYIFYSRFLKDKALTNLAVFFVAANYFNYITMSWVANRNALIGGAFVVLALYFHHRACQNTNHLYKLFACCFVALGLAAGEVALASCAYLFAYALFIDQRKIFRRVLSLVPYALMTLLWLGLYKLGGYGSHGSGLYLDPSYDPVAFLARILLHLPILLAYCWGGVTTFFFNPGVDGILVSQALIAMAFIVLCLGILAPLLKQSAVARFFALGSVIALLPVCAGLPQPRLVLMGSLGTCALLALLAQFYLQHPRKNKFFSVRKWATFGFVFLFFIHGVLHPLALLGNGIRQLKNSQNAALRPNIALTLPFEQPLEGQTAVFITVPSPFFLPEVVLERKQVGMALPADISLLSMTQPNVRVEIVNDSTLAVHSPDGVMPNNFLGVASLVFCDLMVRPYVAGDRIDTAIMSSEIIEVNELGAPVLVHHHFHKALTDRSLIFYYWDRLQYKFNVLKDVAGLSEVRVL